MTEQATFTFPDEVEKKFREYHEKNPHIYDAFEMLTLRTIKKGFKHYGSKGIFEILRWRTGIQAGGDDPFKINNNFAPLYSRLFEEKHPEHIGFFRKKKSKFD